MNKQIFIDTISSTPIIKLPIMFDKKSLKKLSENISHTKIFLLGETHGVKENVDVIYTLFKTFGFKNLALEWNPKLQESIEKFILGDELDFDLIKESDDGRITAGHFALFKKLKSENLLDTIICFDDNKNEIDWDKRDQSGADYIFSHLPDSPTLIVAGNLHTRIEPFAFKNQTQKQHPLGEHIKNKIPQLATGKISYQSGTYYNLGIHEFDTTDRSKNDIAKFYQNTEDLFIFEIQEAHAATVPCIK